MVHLTKLFTIIPLSNYFLKCTLNIIDFFGKVNPIVERINWATLVNGRFYTTDV